jgi:UDP-N-acetyl-2-amino-2-deoxyglucuronate dehydrogenase
MKRFALIGAAGYIAPRHMKAIQDTGNILVAAYDPYDGVGVLDNYFPEAHFFTEFERFDRHIEKLRQEGQPVDFMVICSPNHLHDSHIRFALKSGCQVICEKPIVLNPWNLDSLLIVEAETKNRVFSILQLRLHPQIIALKRKIDEANSDQIFTVDLKYITARGRWYHHSWKGNESKSGGIATNIGIHFFDMLIWIFGEVIESTVHSLTSDKASGELELTKAQVKWNLSIDQSDLPKEFQTRGKKVYRSIRINDEEFEFSEGFEDLHSASYREILVGNGFGLLDAKKSIELVHQIRKQKIEDKA